MQLSRMRRQPGPKYCRFHTPDSLFRQMLVVHVAQRQNGNKSGKDYFTSNEFVMAKLNFFNFNKESGAQSQRAAPLSFYTRGLGISQPSEPIYTGKPVLTRTGRVAARCGTVESMFFKFHISRNSEEIVE
jgi:hypothetical protein